MDPLATAIFFTSIHSDVLIVIRITNDDGPGPAQGIVEEAQHLENEAQSSSGQDQPP